MEKTRKHTLRRVFIAVFWMALILLLLLHRDRISPQAIAALTPSDQWLAAGIMLLLFSAKSLLFVVYGGILYAACGMIFPLPAAIAVNLAGTVLMTSVPFFVGKRLGQKRLEGWFERHPKLKLLQNLPRQSPWFFSFLIRMIGLLPADAVGMYLGAGGLSYLPYITGSILGLLPSVIAFSVMGGNVENPASPQFLISAAAEVGLMLGSVLLYILWKRTKEREAE